MAALSFLASNTIKKTLEENMLAFNQKHAVANIKDDKTREGILACDVWMIICLGLDHEQLKQFYFFNTAKKAAKVIRIKHEN